MKHFNPKLQRKRHNFEEFPDYHHLSGQTNTDRIKNDSRFRSAKNYF